MHVRRSPPWTPLLALLVAAGCASAGDDDSSDASDDTSDDATDDGAEVDAGAGAPDGAVADAAIPIDCPSGDLGALGTVPDPTAFRQPIDPADPDGAQTYVLFGSYSDEVAISLVLTDDRGPFAGGVVEPGSFGLDDEDASLNTCGVCLVVSLTGAEGSLDLLAVAGSATIDSVEGELAGSAQGLAFQQLDPDSGDVVAGGCTATADGVVDFSAALPAL